MALRELLAVRPVEERQVRVARRLGAERGQDQQLLRGVREVVVAADHIGDPHVGVVDRDREVVERGAVAARDHEVVLEPVLEPDRARGSGPPPRSRPRPGPAGGSRRPRRRGPRPDNRRRRGPASRRGRPRRWRGPGTRVPASTSSSIRSRWRSLRGRTGSAGPRPSRARATAARRGSARRSPGSSAHGRCPRSAAPARRPSPGRRASCRAPCGRRRCAGRPSATGRSESCGGRLMLIGAHVSTG